MLEQAPAALGGRKPQVLTQETTHSVLQSNGAKQSREEHPVWRPLQGKGVGNKRGWLGMKVGAQVTSGQQKPAYLSGLPLKAKAIVKVFT